MIFARQCFVFITITGRGVHDGDMQVRNLVLGTGSENILLERTQLNRLRWLGHLLHMATVAYLPCLICLLSHGLEEARWRSTDGVESWIENMYSEVR